MDKGQSFILNQKCGYFTAFYFSPLLWQFRLKKGPKKILTAGVMAMGEPRARSIADKKDLLKKGCDGNNKTEPCQANKANKKKYYQGLTTISADSVFAAFAAAAWFAGVCGGVLSCMT